MEPPAGPIVIFAQRVLGHGMIGVDAIAPDGRRITVTVPRWNSTGEGIDAEIRRSYAALIQADSDRLAVLASYAADERDPDAMVDPYPDATTG